MKQPARFPAACFLLFAAGCGGGSDANVEGNWTVAVTNRDNGCAFANWEVGNQASNIPVAITQEGSNVTATITGAVGGYVAFLLGSATFTGGVDGDALTLELFGRAQTQGNCSFSYNAVLIGDVDGDTMTGRIEYRGVTNNNPDCAAIEGCVSFQEFNGTRPPT